jgi:hypothetical protein
MTYQEGDRIKVKATGKSGVVRTASFHVKRSVGTAEVIETQAVMVTLDNGGESAEVLFTHEEIEKSEIKKDKHEHVQPEREHRGKSSTHKR